MKIAIHQPHYWPWLGYMHKMASVDRFVLMDTVQMEKGSYMYRNRILSERGSIVYLTIPGEKHGYLDKQYRELLTADGSEWGNKQVSTIERAYCKSPFFKEVFEQIEPLYCVKMNTICQYAIESILILRKLLEINNQLVPLSDIDIGQDHRKNDLVLAICKALNASEYLSGNGAKHYMQVEVFEQEHIHVAYQEFACPEYRQISSDVFVPGLSTLDMLFNCGIQKSREIFQGTLIHKDDEHC